MKTTFKIKPHWNKGKMVKTTLLTFSMAGIIGGIAAIVSLILSNHLHKPVVNETVIARATTSSTQAGVYQGEFDLELFIFITLIIIISMVVIATIGAIIFLFVINHKRKKRISVQYDIISEEDTQSNLLDHSVNKEVKS